MSYRLSSSRYIQYGSNETSHEISVFGRNPILKNPILNFLPIQKMQLLLSLVPILRLQLHPPIPSASRSSTENHASFPEPSSNSFAEFYHLDIIFSTNTGQKMMTNISNENYECVESKYLISLLTQWTKINCQVKKNAIEI